jgi:hypothetical protein
MDGKKKHTIQTYSNDIGVVFKEVKGSLAEYTFSGDELYVRATVISSKLKDDPHVIGEVETAWVQPVLYRSDHYGEASLSDKSAGGAD